MIRLGIEELVGGSPIRLEGKRLGLLCNQASTDQQFRHSRDLVRQAFPQQLTTLFSPQHGFFGEKQDNMIESDHCVDPVSGLRVYSLYGETRRPYPDMFDDIDVLLVDLQDVGTRVYTFIWTVVHCLQTAAETDTEVVILDRPNPLGGIRVEGNLLRPEWASFVGLHTIPMRHGLTVGELALLCNQEMAINAPLSVVPMRGWRRAMLFADTGCPWVLPSPNMPAPMTALVYPGQVIWEGTSLSEGRGTTMPFELFGAPFVEPWEVLARLERYDLSGCLLRPLYFEPVSQKWSGRSCGGFQLHVTDATAFSPYLTTLSLLQVMLDLYPRHFSYTSPPYEYEYTRLPLDLILGDQQIRLALEAMVDPADLARGWQAELQAYRRRCRSVFLYD